MSWEKNVSHLRACGDDLQQAHWHDVEAPVLPNIYQRFIAAIRGEGVADPDFARGACCSGFLTRPSNRPVRPGKA